MNRRDFLLGAGAVALTPTLLKAQVDPSLCGPQVGIRAGLPGGQTWLSAENGGGGDVRANRTRMDIWETFQMVPVTHRNLGRPNPSIEGWWRFITHYGWALETDEKSHVLTARRNVLSRQGEFHLTWLGGTAYNIWGIHGYWSLDKTQRIFTDYSAPNNAFSRFELWGG